MCKEKCFPKLNNFLCTINILDPEFQKARKIFLFEKAKCLLPFDILQIVQEKLEEQGVKIKRLLTHRHQKINLHEGIPKLTILLNHEDWFAEDIEWGISNQVIFKPLAVNPWWSFPVMIKLIRNLKWGKYFTLWMTSSVRWGVG
jgi:hypothetical protein